MPINHYLSLVYWEPTRFFLGLEEVLGVLGVVGSECLRVAEVEGVGLQGSSAMTASGVLDLGLWVSGSKTDVAGLAVGDEWVWEGHGFSFHCETLALTPRRYSWRVERRERWAEPSGSLNATTSDEWEPFLRVEGGCTLWLRFWRLRSPIHTATHWGPQWAHCWADLLAGSLDPKPGLAWLWPRL